MLVALVESNGRGVSGVGFPFGGISNGQADPFPTNREDRLRKKLTPDQWNLLIAQKPYPGGNDVLWAINEIANFDKHRKDLVEVRPVLGLRNFNMSGGTFNGGFQIGGQFNGATYDKKLETIMLSMGGAVQQPDINTNITFRVVFSNIIHIQGHEVTGLTDEQIRLTQGIIQLFASAFG